MYFSKNLKGLRISQKLKQSELDEKLGVGKNATSNYELGRINPTLETLLKIADYFSVSIDGLLRQDMAVEGVNEPAAKYGATIKQTNNGGNGNHNTIIHTESDWAGMEQRIKDLESIIELQKKYIARLEGDAL